MTEKDFIQSIKSGNFAKFEAMLQDNPQLAESFDDELAATALLVAIYYGREEFVAHLTKMNFPLSIWEAVATGNLEMVTKLLIEDSEVVNQYSKDGYFPLGLAAFYGYPHVMEFLIKHGADVNMCSTHPSGVYAINSAAANRDLNLSIKMLKLLLEYGADVNASQNGGFTALHSAASHGHLAKIRALLGAGADRGRKADDGRTALQMAQEGSHEEIILLLGEK